MPETPRVTEVSFRGAHPEAVGEGLLGWTGFVINELIRLDGVAVRRTRMGGVQLSYPSRDDCAGIRHCVVQPFGKHARIEIERQVLAALERPRRRA